jgi:hypothetical protein
MNWAVVVYVYVPRAYTQCPSLLINQPTQPCTSTRFHLLVVLGIQDLPRTLSEPEAGRAREDSRDHQRDEGRNTSSGTSSLDLNIGRTLLHFCYPMLCLSS